MSEAIDLMEEMLGEVVPHAIAELEESGHFDPFGASVIGDGKINVFEVEFEFGSQEGSEAVLEALVDELQGGVETGALTATAICADVTAELPGEEGEIEAIQIVLEHREEEARVILIPYEQRKVRGLKLGEPILVDGEGLVFS